MTDFRYKTDLLTTALSSQYVLEILKKYVYLVQIESHLYLDM
jgi:hypothetical protein